jgi:uncharacterized protein YndB with AHSA1/START domain
MIDVIHQITAVQRRLGSRTLDAGEARVITISRTYAADVDDVWDACTDAERIPRWFLPVTGELRLGGRYRIEGNASGEVQRCDPPKGFAATWEYGEEVSWIELRLAPAPDGGTRFELDHIAHVDDERWTEFGPGAVGIGWDSMLLGLSLHLEPDAGDLGPADVATWMASDVGRRFMVESGARWTEADIASGTDEAAARAAGERVIGFYTGASPE